MIGADLIEPDVVLTKDGIPVCRHDLYLSTSTDIAFRPEFASRKRTLGGREDWFVMDFTLAELKTLRAAQPFDGRDRSYDGKFEVPTLTELLDLVSQFPRNSGRDVGLFIEIKQPAAHRQAGLDVSAAVIGVLEQHKKTRPMPRILFQCFDRAEVEQLAGMTPYPVTWLSSGPVDLRDPPRGCAGLGLNKALVTLSAGRSALIEAAHAQGLEVHLWTFRDDRLPQGGPYTSGPDEIAAYLEAGADGVFTDFPASGIAARASVVDNGTVSER